ncbi:hypothetical protein D3C84_670430 [compost metagenome]
MEETDRHQAEGACDVGADQHPEWVAAIHGPTQDNSAHGAANLKHGADQRRLAELQAGILDQDRQPTGHHVNDQQTHGERTPQQQGSHAMATAENLVDRRLASVGFTDTIVNLIAEVACQRLCRDALQNGADPRRRRRALHQESHRLRQQYKQKWQTQQR